MPARSNEFQRLVLAIQRAIAETGFTVRESAMLTDALTGEEREVDVLIEGTVAGQALAIGIECRDHSRPCTVEWIDQIEGKYRNLPVDIKVAVSRSGFTAKATKRAEKLRIGTMTLEEASEAEWSLLPWELGSFLFTGFKIDLIGADLWTEQLVPPEIMAKISSRDSGELHSNGGERIGGLEDIWRGLLKSGYLIKHQEAIFAYDWREVEHTVTLSMKDAYLAFDSGERIAVSGISLHFIARKAYRGLIAQTNRFKFGEHEVAEGVLDLETWGASVVIAAAPDKGVKIASAVWEAEGSPMGRSSRRAPQTTTISPKIEPAGWSRFFDRESLAAVDQTRDDIVADLARNQHASEFIIQNITCPNREIFDNQSQGFVRHHQAIECVRNSESISICDFGADRFFATRTVRLDSDNAFVVLVVGHVKKGEFAVDGAYRIYPSGDAELETLSSSPGLSFAILLERFGIPFLVAGRSTLFASEVTVPPLAAEGMHLGDVYEWFAYLGLPMGPDGEEWHIQNSVQFPGRGQPIALRGFYALSLSDYRRAVEAAARGR